MVVGEFCKFVVGIRNRETKMKVFRVLTWLLVALVGTVSVSSCGGKSDSSKPVVTVSIEPQRYLLEKIVGDSIEINVLLADGTNPETFNPSMETMKQIAKSDAYFSIGLLGFEPSLIEKLKSNNPDLNVVDTSSGIVLISGGCSGHGEGYDPHVWSSARNAKVIARTMYEEILKIDPDNKAFYEQNYNTLLGELDGLDAYAVEKLSGKTGRAFVVWHPSLSYFADDYGLHQISVGQEGKEQSMEHLRHCIEEVAEHGAQVGFVQKEFDAKARSVMENDMKLSCVDVNLLSYDWDTEMRKVIDAIAEK